ncbi:hypothetical protein M0R45_035775 [Rubus argutus]|uniref:Uncharacterized protein n=1 Tax=Rubus argutus TaxID=59490 RepID=A0AAW1VVM8_RUBAR
MGITAWWRDMNGGVDLGEWVMRWCWDRNRNGDDWDRCCGGADPISCDGAGLKKVLSGTVQLRLGIDGDRKRKGTAEQRNEVRICRGRGHGDGEVLWG